MKKLLQTSALLLASISANATTFGPVENFDVINDTGTTAHGFEIKLHGIRHTEITSVFGNASRWHGMECYGAPTILESTDASGQPATTVTYVGNFDGTNWNAGLLLERYKYLLLIAAGL